MTDTSIAPSTSIALAGALLEFILELLGKNITNATAQMAINFLEQWLPSIIAEASSLLPQAKQMISLLKGSSVLTADQVASVDAMNKVSDDAFDAAAAANGV